MAKRYQRGNQNQSIDEEHTIQWPKKKGQTIQWPKEKGQTIQWPKEKGQTIQWPKEKGQTIQWPKEKGQTKINNTLHRKLNIEQHESHYKQGVNSGARKGNLFLCH
jgi:hypothetical protein